MNVIKVKEFSSHQAGIYTLNYDSSENKLYSAGADKMVGCWNLKTLDPGTFSVKTQHTIYGVYLSAVNNLLYIFNAVGGIHVIDMYKRKEIKYILAHKHAIFSFAFNEAENILAVATIQGELSLWNTSTHQIISYIPISTQKIRKLLFFKDLLYVASSDGKVIVLDYKKKEILNIVEAHSTGVNALLIWDEKNILFTGGRDAYMKAWDISREYSLHLNIPAHNFAIYNLVFSPDKKYIATASRDKTIKVWNAKTLEILYRIDFKKDKGHTHSVNTIVWTPDYLISAGDDRKIILWKIEENS